MKGEIREIGLDVMRQRLGQLGLSEADEQVMFVAARDSYPLYEGVIGEELLCLVGLIPPTVLSDVAYIWCYDTPSAKRYPITFGRHARQLIAHLHELYPRIVGHCQGPAPIAWLTSLGARFIGNVGPAQTFEIT